MGSEIIENVFGFGFPNFLKPKISDKFVRNWRKKKIEIPLI